MTIRDNDLLCSVDQTDKIIIFTSIHHQNEYIFLTAKFFKAIIYIITLRNFNPNQFPRGLDSGTPLGCATGLL